MMLTTTQERLRELLTYDPDTGVFVWKPRPRSDFASHQSYLAWHTMRCGQVAGCAATGRGYIKIRFDSASFFAHRLAWLYHYGKFPTHSIDHINGDYADNRIANLRDVTVADNNRNTPLHADNTSGVQGVCWHSRDNCWTSQIGVAGRQKSLGYFATKEEATEARRAAEQQFEYHPNHGRIPSRNWERRS